MSLRKAVLPAAGLGTRLLSATKESPKEMLPLFARANNGERTLKPTLQLIFEQLFTLQFRDFCFIVGRGKRSLEDHFTPDAEFLRLLNNHGKQVQASELETFYRQIEASRLMWVNQPAPRGFGDAVLCARPFVNKDTFLVHAGDTYICSPGHAHVSRLATLHARGSYPAALCLQKLRNPRLYGIAEVERTDEGLRVREVIEKPKVAKSRYAIMPIYLFTPTVFDALERVEPDEHGELQLTDGIQYLIDHGAQVFGDLLSSHEVRLDIGTPQTYWEAQAYAYRHPILTALRKRRN